jgi:hypothetical protein
LNSFIPNLKILLPLLCVVLNISCAASPMIQPQVNSLVVGKKYNEAIQILENNELSYGKQNKLLFLLDYALVLHIANRYEDSIKAFEKAKNLFDQYYTVSVSNEASTWLINDNLAPYRGEDFERAMINVFQAINYAALGNIEEALVEARDVDLVLTKINRQYKKNQKNTYKEDSFIRFFMGMLYEMEKTPQGYNDAFISYKKAINSYESDFKTNYKVDTPQVLKENFLSVAKEFDFKVYKKYKKKFSDVNFLSVKEKEGKAQVVVIHYFGFSPIKHQMDLPIPLPGGYLMKLAFPRYDKRKFLEKPSIVKIQSVLGSLEEKRLEKATDISAIAIESLKRRQKRVVAKAAVRTASKYFIERSIEKSINKKFTGDGANWFKYAASIYNITSEQADLRSWLALPGEIHITRFILDPGAYAVIMNKANISNVTLKKGEVKIITYRSK